MGKKRPLSSTSTAESLISAWKSKATSASKALQTAIPPPPGQPVKLLPAGQRPKEVPAGVPEYNFRMCQYDIIKMGQKNQNLTFDNPTGHGRSRSGLNLYADMANFKF